MLTTKEAWQEIQNRVGAELEKIEAGPFSSWNDSPSLNDQIQKLYREEKITEPQRDEMREYLKVWLGDGTASDDDWDWFADPAVPSYDTYACGLWAASAGPMGAGEHSIILMTLQILCEEVAA